MDKSNGASASPTAPLGLRPEPASGLGHSASVDLPGSKRNITRTIILDDLTPQELARVFSIMASDEQAAFFNALHGEVQNYGGTGWCGQCAWIVDDLDRGGRDIIKTLAGHVADKQASLARTGQS